MTSTFRDAARFWRSPLLPDVELLTAEYFAQEFAPHWHEGYAIPVIQAGAQSYRYRGARCVAGAGSIAAINPGEIHTGERATDNGWAYRAFYPSLEWMQQLSSDMAGCAVGVPWLPDGAIEDGEVAFQLGRAHRLLEAGADDLAAQTVLTGAFALLLSRYARTCAPLQTIHPDAVRVELMKAALSAHLTEPMTLSDLAAAVGLSPFYTARLFSRMVGMPPHAWRNQLRLNRAQGLLRQGCSVTEVAASVGYADQSHFTRHFKRAFGVAPGRWRR
ncbi:AraC family transcriptional regulator [Janthinobacterium fluminis]|uniref:AraC family transcriptional regulator n=1 Tax=Janthinobacterium fluminis TaxID=2987524 RepID=A0ABT5JY08_9BURK|nr:AraC family transcriptional regulator [Janthinobacterium fluminis]MDC8756432.1 AraC family transcriptional regulator [Janthinobacterium fluminis]